MTAGIQSQISELELLHQDGFIFRGHEDFEYKLIPKVFRPDKIREMSNQFSVAEREIYHWFNSKTIIDLIDQWAPGARMLAVYKQPIQRLLNYCLYLMYYNYALSIFSQKNKHRISSGDCSTILIRDAEYWRQEETFYNMFSHYFPTIIERRDFNGNLLQGANPYEDLAGVDESLPQHYGISTAALDWSRNYRIAIYFAVGDNSTKARFLKIFAIKMHEGFSSSPVKIMEKNAHVENIRAERQEGTFTYFAKPCTFYLQHGVLPTIDHFDRRYKNSLDDAAFDLRSITIERTKDNIKYLEKILIEKGISKEFLFPDLCEEAVQEEN